MQKLSDFANEPSGRIDTTVTIVKIYPGTIGDYAYEAIKFVQETHPEAIVLGVWLTRNPDTGKQREGAYYFYAVEWDDPENQQ